MTTFVFDRNEITNYRLGAHLGLRRVGSGPRRDIYQWQAALRQPCVMLPPDIAAIIQRMILAVSAGGYVAAVT